VQCLAHTTSIREYFLSNSFLRDLNEENFLGTGGKLAREFGKLLTEMCSSEHDSMRPESFVSMLLKLANQFNGGGQHDAQELLLWIRYRLSEDTNRVRGVKPAFETEVQGTNESDEIASARARTADQSREDSFVNDQTYGQVKNTTTCASPQCPNQSIKYDPIHELSVTIPGGEDAFENADANSNANANESTITSAGGLTEAEQLEAAINASLLENLGNRVGNRVDLEDCIRKYSEPEQLGQTETWECSQCNVHVRAMKTLQVYRTPPILIVHLKRFYFSESGNISIRRKIDTWVDFPLRDLKICGSIYDLYAVSNHISAAGEDTRGHYTAYCKGEDGTWRNYNDDEVTVINETDVVSQYAYILFYKRKEPE